MSYSSNIISNKVASKRYFIFTAIILALTSLNLELVYPQETTSVHKFDKLQHQHLTNHKSEFDESGKDIIPLQKKKNQLTKTVFGYLPSWEYYTNRNYIRYDLLTHIAAFDFTVDSMGNVANPYYWPWTDVINKAHLNGVKVILTAVNFEPYQIKNILRNQTAKTNFFNQVKDKMLQFQLDGINVDFEDLKSEDRGAVLNAFMVEFTNFIKFYKPDAEVSFAGPSINWGGWDLRGLVESCDYVFIMGYAFYGSWSSTSGPGAPLTGGNYNISNVVFVQYSWATQFAPGKLILGVPYYGNKWKTQDSLPNSPVIKSISTTRFRNDVDSALIFGRIWAANYNVPWYQFKRDGEWYQVWYDDEQSLALKYNLADSQNYMGVGMWALGYDGDKPHLWNELQRRYLPVSVSDNSTELLPNFVLHQNYPNPFNPVTVISYQLAVAGHVSLKIYDLLGREVTTLVDEEKPSGSYTVNFSASQLSTGVYFYELKSGTYRAVKKLMLVK